MVSVSSDQQISQVEQAIWNVLLQSANTLARSTGFIRRQRKVTGAGFAQMLVLGLLADPNASLEALVQFGADVGLELTAQGLDERWTPAAGNFFEALFDVAIAQVVTADPVAIPLLERFRAVNLEDSTIVHMPDALARWFRGCGGSQRGKGKKAACKLQVRLEMLRGQLICSSLLNGRQTDTRTPLCKRWTQAGTINLRDRGFADVARWQEEASHGEYTLSYFKNKATLFDAHGQVLDLIVRLEAAPDQGEMEVLIGAEQRFPMRLLFERVPQAVVEQRQRKLREEARSHSSHLSETTLHLAQWTIVLTTAPNELLSVPEALVLLRLRWQMELLFRLWKEHGLLDQWRTEKPERIRCEVYAKLIGLLIQHWLLITGCWDEPHRSMSKAAKAVRSHAILFAVAFCGDLSLTVAIRRTQQATHVGARLNARRDAPNTSQLLFIGHNVWPSKPKKMKEDR